MNVADTPRVLLLALDGFPHRAVAASQTPNLWRLGLEGGRAPDGGRSPLPSTTYPGFASLLTGAGLDTHRVRTTFCKVGAVPGWAGESRVAVPTLLDACHEAGIGAAAIMGDQKLYRVLGAGSISALWPAGGRLPDRASLDAHGYLTNEAAWPAMVEAIRGPDHRFLFCHLNEADTVGHDYGPASKEAAACYRATDRVVGFLLDALRETWDEWLLIVVSDHDMEPRGPAEGVDPMTIPGVDAVACDWVEDGGSAWLQLRPGIHAESVSKILAASRVVDSWRWFGDRLLLLASPGHVWHAGHVSRLGLHGGPGTRRTVAIVGGGHPAVRPLARAIRHHTPELRDWAPTIAQLLGVGLPDADGLDLLTESTMFG